MRIAASKRGLKIALVHSRDVALSEFAQIKVHAAPGREAAAASELTDAIVGAERPVVLLGPRMYDPDTIRAWTATGARIAWLPRRAGTYGALAAGAHPDLLPGWRSPENDADCADVAAAWHTPIPGEKGLDVAGMLGRASELGVLWLIGADPLDEVVLTRRYAAGEQEQIALQAFDDQVAQRRRIVGRNG